MPRPREFEIVEVDENMANRLKFRVRSGVMETLGSTYVQRELIKKAREDYGLRDPAIDPQFGGGNFRVIESGEGDEKKQAFEADVTIVGSP